MKSHKFQREDGTEKIYRFWKLGLKFTGISKSLADAVRHKEVDGGPARTYVRSQSKNERVPQTQKKWH